MLGPCDEQQQQTIWTCSCPELWFDPQDDLLTEPSYLLEYGEFCHQL